MKADLKKWITIVLCSGAIIAAFLWIVRVLREGAPDLEPFAMAGEVLADETASLLNGEGQIVVVALDTEASPIPYAVAQLAAFEKKLKKKSRINIMAIERVSPGSGEALIYLSGAKYSELVRRYEGADAIISFVGSPSLTEAELRQLPANPPRGVMLGDTMGAHLQRLFQAGIVEVAVTKRFTPQAGPGREPSTSKEWFDFYFELVRTNNDKPSTHP